MTGKGSPKTHRGLDSKGPKLKVPEAEHGAGYGDKSPAKKMKVQSTKPPANEMTDGFETEWENAVREINQFFTQYSDILRERAAIDAAQVEELGNILTEAISLETQLKEKKEHLRRSLAIISDKLQE